MPLYTEDDLLTTHTLHVWQDKLAREKRCARRDPLPRPTRSLRSTAAAFTQNEARLAQPIRR